MTGRFYVFKAGDRGTESAVALAVRLGLPCITDVKAIRIESGLALLEKDIFSGELSARIETRPPCCIALARDFEGGLPEELLSREPLPELPLSEIVTGYDSSGDELSGAELVLAVGRGIGSREAAQRAAALAGRLGVKIGATRAAVMNGWLPMSAQIGVSGVSIAARVCLVLGASGAGAFTAGLEKCGTVIAVNTDKSAPIFKRADVGIIGSCGELLDRLEQYVDQTCP